MQALPALLDDGQQAVAVGAGAEGVASSVVDRSRPDVEADRIGRSRAGDDASGN